MNKRIQRIISVVADYIGEEAAYDVSVALHAADTLRRLEPDKFKEAWGTEGYRAIEQLFEPDK